MVNDVDMYGVLNVMSQRVGLPTQVGRPEVEVAQLIFGKCICRLKQVVKGIAF